MKIKLSNILIMAAIPVVFWSCSNSDVHPPKPNCDNPEWTYDVSSKEGPNGWGDVCYEYVYCKGGRQSPINIVGAITDATLPAITIAYNASKTAIINTGHTLQWNCDANSSKVTYNGEDYSLVQFHFHTDAEHTINGITMPMEVHLVHQSSAGKLLVIGVIFTVTATDNPLLATFLPNLPSATNGTYNSATTFSPTNLLATNTATNYYTYSGSLTTPPCSEDVTWIVAKNTLTASATQIATFKSIMKINNRPILPLNGRIIRTR